MWGLIQEGFCTAHPAAAEDVVYKGTYQRAPTCTSALKYAQVLPCYCASCANSYAVVLE